MSAITEELDAINLNMSTVISVGVKISSTRLHFLPALLEPSTNAEYTGSIEGSSVNGIMTAIRFGSNALDLSGSTAKGGVIKKL